MSAASNPLLSILTLTEDKLSLVVRKGAKVSSSLTKLKHSELSDALNQMKIKTPPHKNTVTVIREAARVGTYSGNDFEVCRGEPPRS
ncbi:hypothetical protein EBR21_13955, partial [bacterium]|nr:hypothetical protein [bacterium]